MKRQPLLSLAAALAGALIFAPVVAAQDAPPPARPGETELVAEREIFTYPARARSNPFRPLSGPGGSGPRFEALRLIGVIYSDEPGASVALWSFSSK